MEMVKVTRRYVTLIEMMIVMFLIAMIAAVLAYNYQGSLEKGRAFKTEQTMEKMKTILVLHLAQDPTAFDRLDQEWKSYVRQSPLVSDPTKLYTDGWGEEFKVGVVTNQDTGEREVEIRSDRYEQYLRRQ